MLTTIAAVARKELREIVRDRRSLASGLLYGIWGPLVMGLALLALARGQNDDGRLTLPVAGAALGSSLVQYLDAQRVEVVPFDGDASEAIRSRRSPVVLSVSETFPRDFANLAPARVTIAYDASWRESATQAARARTLLATYSRTVGDTRLVLRGVAPSSIEALRIIDRDFSTAAGRAASLLATLPMFVLLSTFIGGMSAAADVTAGERERGSIEPLLSHAVPRLAIALGKWLAVTAVAMLTAILTVVCARLVLAHPRLGAVDLPIGLDFREGLWILGMLAPLAILAAAVQVLIGIRSRTYKEAQSQLSILMFVPMLPGFLLAFGSLVPAPWMSLTPLLGQHVLVADLIHGQAPAPGAVAILSLVTIASGVLAIFGAARLLGSESTLRRHAR